MCIPISRSNIMQTTKLKIELQYLRLEHSPKTFGTPLNSRFLAFEYIEIKTERDFSCPQTVEESLSFLHGGC